VAIPFQIVGSYKSAMNTWKNFRGRHLQSHMNNASTGGEMIRDLEEFTGCVWHGNKRCC